MLAPAQRTEATRFKQPRSVLVVICAPTAASAGIETLLIERADWPGFWQSVTGSSEPGERPRETALRELFEETGFAVEPDSPRLRPLGLINVFAIYPQFRHRYPPGTTHNVETCFLLNWPQAEPPRLVAREHRNFAWVPLGEAIGRVLSWSNAAALRRVAQFYVSECGSVTHE
ncbi:MAG: dihydroneopterin triphosphate diphosphatase [Casimicrobiaceae bacterium]|nr:dihydroneopterin triphosphate diphosphatase [Casimicrobiaceae bacterium]MDW8311309.1 dihydroneopterin triphosphate diphosphatase [Burkholderiales bacterium]